MSVMRCSMCGAHLNILKKSASVECEYCGTVHVLSCLNGNYIVSIEEYVEPVSEKALDEPEEPVVDAVVEVDEEEARLQRIYNAAEVTMNGSGKAVTYQNAAKMFASISGYKDADELATRCEELAEEARIREAKVEEQRQRVEEREEQYQSVQRQARANNKKMLQIVMLVVIFACAICFFTDKYISGPRFQYNKAKDLMREGYYMQAYTAFSKAGDYKDSEDYKTRLRRYMEYSTLEDAEPGDSVYFGVFEQDNNDKNGEELIQWNVYEKSGNKLLLVSQKILDYRQYHTNNQNVTWENSSIRCWLNLDFLYGAFDDEEQTAILKTNLINNDNEQYLSEGGNDTVDKVFLLSHDEIKKYYGQDNDAVGVKATVYVQERSSSAFPEDQERDWWVRTPGEKENSAVYVSDRGKLYLAGHSVEYRLGIRPAMWIDISSFK